MPKPALRKHKMRHILRQVLGTPWAIRPETMEQVCEVLSLRGAGLEFSEAEIRERLAAKGIIAIEAARAARDEEEPPYTIHTGGVAVIPVEGLLGPKLTMMMWYSGGTSTQKLAAAVRQAADDPLVGAIVLEVDSTGGYAIGNEEAAMAIAEAGRRKTLVTVANGDMASAAYYLGVAAGPGRVVASPSSWAGSIGTISVHADYSVQDANAGVKYTVIRAGENKWVPNDYEPLSDKGRANVQAEVDQFNRLFIRGVARYRGVEEAKVLSDFGQGRYFIAEEALNRGLIDRVATIEEVIAELAADLQKPARPSAVFRPTSKQESPMDARIAQVLRDRKLIDEETEEAAAVAILSAYYAGRNKPLPDSTEAILADFAAGAAQRSADHQQPPASPGDGEAAAQTAAALAAAKAAAEAEAEKAQAEAAELAEKTAAAANEADKRATARAAEIIKLSELAGHPEMAETLVSGTVEDARKALFEAVCKERKPVGDSGGAELGTKKADPDEQFKKEYRDASAKRALPVTEAEYVRTRRIDAGLETL